jgi:hypothetical protein
MSVDIYSVGLCYASVCAPANMSVEVLEHAVNIQTPTGIEARWRVAEDEAFADGTPMPCLCPGGEDHKHWLMVC